MAWEEIAHVRKISISVCQHFWLWKGIELQAVSEIKNGSGGRI